MNLFTATESPNDTQMIKNIIKDTWEEGIKVSFYKKDGSLREMIVILNESVLAPKAAPGTIANAILKRRETNRANGNMVVTEYLPTSDSYQIRTIPLYNVISIDTL